jgi:hypothetical protein
MYYSDTFLDLLKKTIENLTECCWFLNQDSNLLPHEYKSEASSVGQYDYWHIS